MKYQNRPEEGKVKEMEDSLRSELERAKAELWRASELQTALSNLQTEMARVQGSSDAEIATLKAEKERLTNQLYHSEGRFLFSVEILTQSYTSRSKYKVQDFIKGLG